MDVFGLIGKQLSHSFSPGYFERKFKRQGIQNAAYRTFELDTVSEIKQVFETPGLKGLNVTIPYKEKVIPFLDELTPIAQEVGAVNTILFEGTKKIGHNTDVEGFSNSLDAFLEDANIDKALVLGSGGAAKAVSVGLKKMGIPYSIASRSGEALHLDINTLSTEIIESHQLLINTTPVGMYPKIEAELPLPWDAISSNHFLFDLIYNPEETRFLKQGKNRGAHILNGHQMLILQAEASYEMWVK